MNVVHARGGKGHTEEECLHYHRNNGCVLNRDGHVALLVIWQGLEVGLGRNSFLERIDGSVDFVHGESFPV